MALTKSQTASAYGHELVFENAYIKVSEVAGNKDSILASVDFLSQKDGEIFSHKTYVFSPDLEGGNFIAQAYAHLKTLPEFASATNC